MTSRCTSKPQGSPARPDGAARPLSSRLLFRSTIPGCSIRLGGLDPPPDALSSSGRASARHPGRPALAASLRDNVTLFDPPCRMLNHPRAPRLASVRGPSDHGCPEGSAGDSTNRGQVVESPAKSSSWRAPRLPQRPAEVLARPRAASDPPEQLLSAPVERSCRVGRHVIRSIGCSQSTRRPDRDPRDGQIGERATAWPWRRGAISLRPPHARRRLEDAGVLA